MLKTVSSIANAIGALNYKGTWDANANVPPLASGVGTKGDYYVVGTAGSTTLDGISNWGIGDWAVFNGSVWQRVEGGANLNGVDLSVSGISQLTGNATFSNNLVQGTAAKGVNFTANTPAAGMTSQLLNWYEEGTWTPVITPATGSLTAYTSSGTYVRVGKNVTLTFAFRITTPGTAADGLDFDGIPFTTQTMSIGTVAATCLVREVFGSGVAYQGNLASNATTGRIYSMGNGAINWSANFTYVFTMVYQCA